jgi:hypothetical protein
MPYINKSLIASKGADIAVIFGGNWLNIALRYLCGYRIYQMS